MNTMSASSGLLPENATAGLHRNPNSVRVDNVSKSSTQEVIALFSALVGQIRSFHEIQDALGTHLEIAFFNRDAATKALCMTGYNIGGAFLAVTPITSHIPNHRSRPSIDDRRNLYVLGLPFALTKNEFAALFSRYGTVSHCVILATVDNSSRRRGFIVMSTHEEAKLAMSELTRTQIKSVSSRALSNGAGLIELGEVRGHTIDVSWAVVQRSQGFLDGGDRTMLLDSRPIAATSRDETGLDCPKEISVASLDNLDPDFGSYTATSDPATTLLVSKLPVILFSQIHDLEPLFYPFGPLKKLQVAGIGLNGTLSVLVQYQSTSAAQEAKEALHGQTYVNNQIEVQFLRPLTTPFDLPLAPRVLSSLEKNRTIKPIPSTNLDAPGICRSLKPFDSQGISDLPNFDKPSFATPSFNSTFHNHNGNMFLHYAGSRWSTDTNAVTQHMIPQHARSNSLFPNSQYQNLLA